MGGHPAIAIALAALSSIAGTVYEPATAALTQQTVPVSQLAAANMFRNTIDNIAIIVGPAIGGLLLVVGSPALVFVVNAATFVFSALFLARMKARSKPVDVTEGARDGPLRQMLVGAHLAQIAPRIAVLQRAAIFANGSYSVIERLAGPAREVSAEAGAAAVSEGEEADALCHRVRVGRRPLAR